MHTHIMKQNTLLALALDTIAAIEKILSDSPVISSNDLQAKLEETLRFSLTHIRSVFKLSTGMSLIKYINRRRYTIILLNMTYETFNELETKKTICDIKEFKKKCLKEFPNLIKHYSILNMQIPLDRKTILTTLNSNIARKGTEYLFKDLKKDITDGREPIEINNTTKFLAVQSGNELLINLEKVYFIYNDFIFNITGTLNVAQNDVELPMSKII